MNETETPRSTPGSLMPFRTSDYGPTVLKALPREELPNRYSIRRGEEGRMLTCDEAPGVAVVLDRGFAFTEADARRLGSQTILLDGAGQFAPTIDETCHLYNLDHHSGCVRAFTLSTCEQALILVLKGLRLDKGEWTLYANEPDLDTVFAIWVLLNYRRLHDLSPEQRDILLPMLRLEGAIDANGLEIAECCGLPNDVLTTSRERLDRLHRDELEVKRSGAWATLDLYEYTRDKLLAIDHLVYQASDFGDYASIDEVFGHVMISDDQVAVICRDGEGIYEVEKRLKKVWGDRLGLIALEKDRGHYTLRRTAGLSGIALDPAYDKLNLLDPQVDGRPPQKRWGGSDDIGGSPRPTGTRLTPTEIGKILRLAYRPLTRLARARRLLVAGVWVVGLLAMTFALTYALQVFRGFPRSGNGAAAELAAASTFLAIGSWFGVRRLSRGWTWLFGWRMPAGFDWAFLAPVTVLAVWAGGSWIPQTGYGEAPSTALLVTAVTLAAVAVELCFRSLLHGALVLDHRIQRASGRWFLSFPTILSAVVYGLVTAGLSTLGLWIAAPESLWSLGSWPTALATATLAGLALGMIRERSLSLIPGVAFLAVGGLLRLFL